MYQMAVPEKAESHLPFREFSTPILTFLHGVGECFREAEGDMGSKSAGCPCPFLQSLASCTLSPPFHSPQPFPTQVKGHSHPRGWQRGDCSRSPAQTCPLAGEV